MVLLPIMLLGEIKIKIVKLQRDIDLMKMGATEIPILVQQVLWEMLEGLTQMLLEGGAIWWKFI